MHEFFAAVDVAQNMELPAGHFVQLWIKTQYLFSTTYVRRADPEASLPMPTESLPRILQPFAIEIDFQRNVNRMFEVNERKGAMREITPTSEGDWRKIDLPRQ